MKPESSNKKALKVIKKASSSEIKIQIPRSRSRLTTWVIHSTYQGHLCTVGFTPYLDQGKKAITIEFFLSGHIEEGKVREILREAPSN